MWQCPTCGAELNDATGEPTHNETIEKCYEVARGTNNLNNPVFTRSQQYWKGRADAANDVRALKTK